MNEPEVRPLGHGWHHKVKHTLAFVTLAVVSRASCDNVAYCFILIDRTMRAFGGRDILVFKPMEVITQQRTAEAKAGAVGGCAWVVVVQIVRYLIDLGFLQNPWVAMGEGGAWLGFVVIEGDGVVP